MKVATSKNDYKRMDVDTTWLETFAAVQTKAVA